MIGRRELLIGGCAAMRARADGSKGEAYSAESRRFPDPATEIEVFRLTDPQFNSTLPAYYGRSIAKNSSFLIYGCDRGGPPQAFRLDLKSAAIRQLTEAQDLDVSSLTLTPDNRSFCYFAGRSLWLSNLANLRERELYRVPEGWERGVGMTVGPDGTHATFVEVQGSGSRLRMVPLTPGAARTVIEAPFAIGDPIPRPMRAQILYRQQDEGLWVVNMDGKQARQLKTADGRIGPANWAPDGKTVLYLNFPSDRTQLNSIRELTPDTNTDKLLAKTSQFVHFGFNRDSSVFVGASRNTASPHILLLLRVTRREFTLCEHKSSHPETTAPRFSPDSQRVYFQSDRDGKQAIYCVHVERLVEKTESETG
jgi:oligogalacturonide lyase